MKKIDAVVRPHRLEDIVNRLRLIGVVGMTVSEVSRDVSACLRSRAPRARPRARRGSRRRPP
jgi:hypothetical protein